LRQGWIVGVVFTAFVPLSGQVSAEAVNHTTAENLVSVLDGYYEEVNRQLDKRLNRTRQPFVAQIKQDPKTVERREVSTKQKNSASSGNFSNVSRRISDFSSNSIVGMPVLSIKGFLENEGEKAALLDIEGQGVLMVREGDKIGLQQVADSAAVLRVVEINELNLTLKADSSGEEFVVQ